MGTPCDLQLCAVGQHCWETVVNEGCVDNAPTVFYRDWTCDGPEDCDAGACCLDDVSTPQVNRYQTTCQPDCALATTTLCNVDGDCPNLERCCATPLRGTVGVCRPTCAE